MTKYVSCYIKHKKCPGIPLREWGLTEGFCEDLRKVIIFNGCAFVQAPARRVAVCFPSGAAPRPSTIHMIARVKRRV